ncbi:HAUS augmin-like complex subunit 8 isoform X2 [Heptranchias perlo]|uniref:HAUS augmin-like complex subunit 8 isoform X2 n=1 Tax=Heptranchias perlo TaxID=212740 RepID=UPI003559647C
MAARGRRSVLGSKRSANLTTSKQLRPETEPKSAYTKSTQSSQQKPVQVASKQLPNKPTTPNLKRRDSFGQCKPLNEDSNGSSNLLKSSKSVPDLSESRYLSITNQPPSSAVLCRTPTPVTQRVSQGGIFQRATPKPHAVSQNVSHKKLYREENEGSGLMPSMEEYIRKSKGAREVQSRFREAAAMKKKVVSKGHEKSSGPGLKRLNIEKKSLDLHSTGLEESMLMPSLNWDLSAMKPEYSTIAMPEYMTSVIESALPPSLSDEDAIEVHDFNALLYSYMAITREKNLAKYQEKAERNLLLIEEENHHLRREIFQQKQELLLQEKQKQLDKIIDQQMELLRPVLASIQQFKIQYKSLGQALDTTRHSLQMKNISMSEDLRENLEELKIYLETTTKLLDGLGLRPDTDNSKALAGIKELGAAVAKTDTEMRSFFAKIEEVASCISRETALIHQELDEQALGMEVSAKGIFK